MCISGQHFEKTPLHNTWRWNARGFSFLCLPSFIPQIKYMWRFPCHPHVQLQLSCLASCHSKPMMYALMCRSLRSWLTINWKRNETSFAILKNIQLKKAPALIEFLGIIHRRYQLISSSLWRTLRKVEHSWRYKFQSKWILINSHRSLILSFEFKEEVLLQPNAGSITMKASTVPLVSHIIFVNIAMQE